MKLLIVLGALFLLGCAETKTLEELEFAALESGDWSAVERREKAIARRKAQRAVSCPAGLVPVCENRLRQASCSCMSHRQIQDLLGRF